MTTFRLAAFGLTTALCTLLSACASPTDEGGAEGDAVSASSDSLTVTGSFVARGTGYYPDGSALEGGFVDRRGVKLRTLQQFLAGSADYVSVAMDASAFPYGQHLRIHEVEAKYGRVIDFRVVDTGGAFRGRGRSRIDICVASNSASLDPVINGSLHIDAVTGAASSSSSSSGSSSSGSSGSSGSASSPGTSVGASCSTDGQCNPGNDGAGKICTAGHCVAGCRSNAQCPGSATCAAGQCR